MQITALIKPNKRCAFCGAEIVGHVTKPPVLQCVDVCQACVDHITWEARATAMGLCEWVGEAVGEGEL